MWLIATTVATVTRSGGAVVKATAGVLHSTAVLQAGTAQYIKKIAEPGIFLEICTERPRD